MVLEVWNLVIFVISALRGCASASVNEHGLEGRIYEDAPSGTLVTLHPEFDTILRTHRECLIRVLGSMEPPADSSYFQYDPSKLTLTNALAIDRQVGSYYEVPVGTFCVDDRPAVQWMVKIRVSQLNRFAPAFDTDQYTFWMSRRTEVGTTVGYVRAHDTDVVIYNSLICYKLVKSDQSATTAAAHFEIDGKTGAIRLVSRMKEDDDSVHSAPFEVEACDYGSPQKCGVAKVNVIMVKPVAPTNVTMLTNDVRYQMVCWLEPLMDIPPNAYTVHIDTHYSDFDGQNRSAYSRKVSPDVVNSNRSCVVVDGKETQENENRTVLYYAARVTTHVLDDEATSPAIIAAASSDTISCNGTCYNNGAPACELVNGTTSTRQFRMDSVPYCLCPIRFDGSICQNERFCESVTLQSEHGKIKWNRTSIESRASTKCPYGPDDETVDRSCVWNKTKAAPVWTPPLGLENCRTMEDYLTAVSIARINETIAMNGSHLLSTLSLMEKSAVAIASDKRLTDRMINFLDFTIATDLRKAPERKEIGKKLKSLLTMYAAALPVSPGTASTVSSDNVVATVAKMKTGLVEPIAVDVGREAKLEIPRCVVNQASLSISDPKISAIWLRDDKVFQYEDSAGHRPVLLILLEGMQQEALLLEPIVFSLKSPNASMGDQSTCVYWREASTKWSTRGVRTKGFDKSTGLVRCETTHLTGFSILFDFEPESKVDSHNRRMLNLLSWIGCGISMVALLLTIITYALFPCLHSDHAGKVLLNLCASMLGLNAIFIVSSMRPIAHFGFGVCVSAAALLHYFTLSTLLWMGVEAANMYQMLVHVFASTERSYIAKRCIVAWGIPVVIVLTTLLVNVSHYFDPDDDYCRLSSRYPSVRYGVYLGPACVILLLNCTGFAFVLKVLTQTNSSTPTVKKKANTGTFVRYSTLLAQVRGALSVMVLLGVTWVLGAFAVGPVRLPFMYAFCVLNSLQGFITFLVRCLCYDEARRAWWMLVRTGKLKQQRGKSTLEYRFSGSHSSSNIRHRRSNTTATTDMNGEKSRRLNCALEDERFCSSQEQWDDPDVHLVPHCWKFIDEPSTPTTSTR